MIGNVGPFRDRDTYLRKSYSIMQDMDKLVHELLELSKLESREFRPLMRKVDLSELVREAMNNTSYLAGVKHMELACDLPEEAMIIADERLILKAVSKYYANAVQYSGEGERVYIRLAEERIALPSSSELTERTAESAQRKAESKELANLAGDAAEVASRWRASRRRCRRNP